jgi:hypothetical protein
VIRHEADLAWALALAAKPSLNVVERNGIFVAIGAGETFAVVRTLVKWFAIKRIPVEPDLVRQCVSWLDAYVGHQDERHLRGLIDDLELPLAIQAWATLGGNPPSTAPQPRSKPTPTARGRGAATSGVAEQSGAPRGW